MASSAAKKAAATRKRGELFDMSDAPFVEKPVADAQSEAAAAARRRLQAVLAKLDPSSGKHVLAADKPKKKSKKNRSAPASPALSPATDN